MGKPGWVPFVLMLVFGAVTVIGIVSVLISLAWAPSWRALVALVGSMATIVVLSWWGWARFAAAMRRR